MYQNHPLSGDVGDRGRALVQPGIALGALEVGVDGDLVQVGIPLLPGELRGEERVASGGVDDHLRPELERGRPLRRATAPDPDGAVSVPQGVAHRHPATDVDPVGPALSSIIWSKSLREHLPGRRALVLDRLEEVERLRHLAGRGDELDRVLLRASDLREPVEHAQTLEGEPGVRHQRLADVVAGKTIPFQQRDLVPVLGEQRGRGRAGRPASHHDRIELRACLVHGLI